MREHHQSTLEVEPEQFSNYSTIGPSRMYSFQTSVPLNEEVSLGILNHLNKDELNKLLDDDRKLDDLINDDQQVKRIQIDKDNLLASNRSVAEYNLSLEPKLASAKQHLGRIYEDNVKVQKEYDEKKRKLDMKSSQYSLETVCALLQTEAAKSDETSEKIAEEFLEGNIEVDVFLDTYIPQRTVAHERKVKSEKMIELIRSGATSSHEESNTKLTQAPLYTYKPPLPAGNLSMPNAASYLPR